jgi:L-lactate utilization protein LutB
MLNNKISIDLVLHREGNTMTVKEIRNSLRGEQVVKALKSRNMEAYFVDTKEDALKKALELIPEGSSVGWGGSASIEEIGLKDAVKNGKLYCDRQRTEFF